MKVFDCSNGTESLWKGQICKMRLVCIFGFDVEVAYVCVLLRLGYLVFSSWWDCFANVLPLIVEIFLICLLLSELATCNDCFVYVPFSLFRYKTRRPSITSDWRFPRGTIVWHFGTCWTLLSLKVRQARTLTVSAAFLDDRSSADYRWCWTVWY